MQKNDLSGQIFGRLIVLEKTNSDKWGHPRYLCRCDCKNEIIVRGNDLKNGHTKSCNCINIERLTKHNHAPKKGKSRIYKSWANMIQRCNNPNNRYYLDYGGRGITVCERWLKFENFLKDMWKIWKSGLTLERTKNEIGYCPENCIWATRKQQARNKRNNRLIMYDGEKQCIATLAEKFNINIGTLRKRFELGWSIEKALTEPARKKRRK